MEDVRKRIDYRLVTDPEKIQRLGWSPLFLDRDIIDQEITGVKLFKPTVELRKPIFIGQAVLDYSKLEMYKLFYETHDAAITISDPVTRYYTQTTARPDYRSSNLRFGDDPSIG